jgi:hypothetical protein
VNQATTTCLPCQLSAPMADLYKSCSTFDVYKDSSVSSRYLACHDAFGATFIASPERVLDPKQCRSLSYPDSSSLVLPRDPDSLCGDSTSWIKGHAHGSSPTAHVLSMWLFFAFEQGRRRRNGVRCIGFERQCDGGLDARVASRDLG